jgi:predicted TIM-barrel fold metal-dependent hydrolase
VGTCAALRRTHDAHGVGHALLVQPNSGYGEDNSCLLDALASDRERFRGMAVVPNSTGRRELEALRENGVVGITVNAALFGSTTMRTPDRCSAPWPSST